jgi:hypothetical protein
MAVSDEKQWREYLKRQVAVTIKYTKERGVNEYAIVVVENPEFWLEAFTVKAKAVKWCEKHRLPLREEEKEV